MKYKVWASTSIVGSDIYEEIELDDDLTEDEVEDALYEAIMQYVDWGYKKLDGEKDDDWEEKK